MVDHAGGLHGEALEQPSGLRLFSVVIGRVFLWARPLDTTPSEAVRLARSSRIKSSERWSLAKSTGHVMVLGEGVHRRAEPVDALGLEDRGFGTSARLRATFMTAPVVGRAN